MPKTTITLIGEGAETAQLQAALSTRPDLTVEVREGTFTRMNGNAVRLALSADVILFRTAEDGSLDLETLRSIHRPPLRRATLVALTPPELSLADARRLMQAGAAEVLPWTVEPEELLKQVDSWRSRNLPAIYDAPDRRGKVITVAPARGGIGSSTLAVNLADRLIDRYGLRKTPRNSVVVVDLDLQFGSIASLLDVTESEAFYQMAANGTVPDTTFVNQAISIAAGGLAVLTAPSRFVPLDVLTPAQIGALIDTLTQQYDFVVIDLPRTLVLWVAAVLERTDRLLLVTDSSVPCVRQARRLLDLYLEDNPVLKIDVVMAQENRPLIRANHHAEAAKLLERPFKYWLPPDAKSARRAADRGAPLAEAVGRCALSKSISAMGRDLLLDFSRPVQPARAL